MKIRFGMALDGQHSWSRESCVDRKTVGPQGLLNILETHLGLTAPRPAPAERIIAYRECLRRADNGRRFYSASFAVDELGVAEALLSRRDELFLHGWDGEFRDPGVPQRLRDIADVETQARRQQLAACPGERLAAIRLALADLAVPVTQIQVIDPPASLPPRWREVLDLLPAVFPSAANAGRETGSALERLQARLTGDDAGTICWTDDGSIRIVSAEAPLLGAYWLSGLIEKAGDSTLLVSGGHGELLDNVLAGRGLPQQGTACASVLRPALQVLPLAIRLLWAPADFDAMLAFLALPLSPLRPAYRRRLAAAIAQSPGIGGPAWRAALAEIGKDSEDPGQAMEDIRFWLAPDRHAPQDGIPVDHLRARARRVQQFFQRRIGMDDPWQREAAYGACSQAATFLSALEALGRQGEERVRPAQAERLLVQASAGAHGAGGTRQAGCVAVAEGPAAVCEAAGTVIWWWASAPAERQRVPWYPQEQQALRAAGVDLPSDEERVDRETRSWLLPLLAARRELVLVVPAAIEQRHPVWFTLEALFGKGVIPVAAAEDLLAGACSIAGTRPVAHRRLPSSRRWWEIPGQAPRFDHYPLSHSAAVLLLNDPYQWVLRYAARLGSSDLLRVTDGPQLYGSLAHRLVEELVIALNDGSVSRDAFSHWFDEQFPRLVEQEGAVLLAPGRGAELLSLRRTMHRAADTLLALVADAGFVRLESERRLEGEFKGGRVAGYADLVLHRTDGRAAVIDMKWGSAARHRESLQKGSHLQLVMYAEMLRQQTGTLPGLAYFILSGARLLPADNASFPGHAAVRPPAAEGVDEIWKRFLVTLDWRGRQLERGLVEVASAAAGPTAASMPPEDGLKTEDLNPDYNSYKNLAGWDA